MTLNNDAIKNTPCSKIQATRLNDNSTEFALERYFCDTLL